jgi:ABC-type transporter Mla maintaining outer membrane lipid asymmetry ATPase subunit MlaF
LQKFLLYDEVVTASKHSINNENIIAVIGGSGMSEASRGKEIVMNGVQNEKTFSAGDDMSVDVAANRVGIRVMSATAKWTEDLPENTLTDVTLEVRPGALMAVIGPVGSGKVSYRKEI